MIESKNLSKVYLSPTGTDTVVLKNVSLKLPEGKITALYAPPHSGKSLLLKIVAGLDSPDSGEIINKTQGKIIYFPSAPSSFPWLSVSDNIKLGLADANESDTTKIIHLVGLEGYETFFPANKSFGFRFRIALARSLAHHPSIILIDEAFRMMDDQTRMESYNLIRKINLQRGTTFLLATANLQEAIFLSDKIYLMKNNPSEIFAETDVDLPADRDESTLISEKFSSIRTKIENNFNTIVSRQYISF